ncbi:MAG: GNAT family N-acetyltransferase [Actinomycetota bacterium]
MGVNLRPFAATDAARLAEIATAASAADGHPMVVTTEEIEEEFVPPNVDPTKDVVVAVDGEHVVGYGFTYMLHNPDGDERCYVFGHVDPCARARGVGSMVLDATIKRATAILGDSHGRGARYVRADCPVDNGAARTLFERAGLQPVRWFSDLVRPLDTALDVKTPDGITVQPWNDLDNEALRTVKNDAFADHWGSTPTLKENWEQLTDGYGARRDLSFAAVHEGIPVGILLTHRYPLDDGVVGGRYGWIDKLATIRQYRGRGVASALIARTLEAYRNEGLTHAALNVDSDNPTGASKLYAGLGFVPFRNSVTYSLTLNNSLSAQGDINSTASLH